jgi:hypothetical protein
MLADMFYVIRLEVPVSRLVKVSDDRHDFTDTQSSCSMSLLASISKQFLFPNRQEYLAEIIYTHK